MSSMKTCTAASRVLRQERIDVAHFRESSGEWQISGVGAKVRQLYRESFGQVFHGSPTALAPSKRFALEPLRKGPESIACDPAGPIQHAELKSLKLELPGESRLTLEKRVFETLEILGVLHQPDTRLVEARIDLNLPGRRAAVRLKICPERNTILGATGIPVVEEWLVARGFVIGDVVRIPPSFRPARLGTNRGASSWPPRALALRDAFGADLHRARDAKLAWRT